jgi:hypothetical protein
MIESLTVPLQHFDLTGFIKAFRKVAVKWVGPEIGPDASVLIMEKFDYPPETVFEGRKLVEELVDRGWKLFFPTHEPAAAERPLCIDGKRRSADDFWLGEADNYGFLVEVHDDQISLHPALYESVCSQFPRITLQGRCGVLDDCMTVFARRFVRED